MNKILLVGLLFLFPIYISSQELQVESFVQMGVVEEKNVIKDKNDSPCALIKIIPIQNDIEFENTFITKVEKKDTVYWVYMAQGAKRLRIKHPNYLPKDIAFADYGINTLYSACCYELRIKDNLVPKTNFVIADRKSIDDIYNQGWNYKGEKLSAVSKMIINREALGGKKEAQIAMANICLFEKEYKMALKWVNQLIEDGDSMCLKEMNGELLYYYAINIPQPQMYIKNDEHHHGPSDLLAYVIGQILLKKEYDRASELCLSAYKKEYVEALYRSNEFRGLSRDISADYLFDLMENSSFMESMISDTRNYFGFYLSPVLYILCRELANYGCEAAKKWVAEYDELLGIKNG